MRGTVGEPRTAANTHSVRIPLAGDRVCHQVQLPVQAGAFACSGPPATIAVPERQTEQQQAENDFDVIAFDEGAARAFGAVACALRTAGRKTAARAYDALIAATAISGGLPVYTNTSKR
jgi:hypothetical protein